MSSVTGETFEEWRAYLLSASHCLSHILDLLSIRTSWRLRASATTVQDGLLPKPLQETVLPLSPSALETQHLECSMSVQELPSSWSTSHTEYALSSWHWGLSVLPGPIPDLLQSVFLLCRQKTPGPPPEVEEEGRYGVVPLLTTQLLFLMAKILHIVMTAQSFLFWNLSLHVPLLTQHI